MTITHEDLEGYFHAVIEDNRRGVNKHPCPRDALFAPAFFGLNDGGFAVMTAAPEDESISFSNLPFDTFWIVSNVGINPLCVLVNAVDDEIRTILYLGYGKYGNHMLPSSGRAERRAMAKITALDLIAAIQFYQTAEVESPVQASINRGRAKTIGKASYVPSLPPFIRISHTPRAAAEPHGGTHASPIPHDRRGHWRTYRASGKRVWITNSMVLGGSQVPRNYLVG